MTSTAQFPFLAHNGTVKAWCWTGTSTTKTADPRQDLVDAVNFIDGYNLRLSAASQFGYAASTTDVYTGALRFDFITPMINTKYKVFVQYSIEGALNSVGYAHALNCALYPKTTTSFWVRCGVPIASSGSTMNQLITMTFGPDASPWIHNLRVMVL